MSDVPNWINIDKSLIYVIQKITGDSTAKIVGYFCNLSKSIVEDALLKNKKKKNYVNKTMKWTYEDSCVPFALSVFYSVNYGKTFTATVKFGTKIVRLREKDIMDLIDKEADYSLGLEGAEPVANVAEPMKRAPVAIKKQLKKDLNHKDVSINIQDLQQELVEKFNL